MLLDAQDTSPSPCELGAHDVDPPHFDEVQAAGMDAAEVAKRWPRTHQRCRRCGEVCIVYASLEHFLAGDW